MIQCSLFLLSQTFEIEREKFLKVISSSNFNNKKKVHSNDGIS